MGLNSFGLDAFYICAQEKNFTRASEKLHITQSALSQRIKNLEEEFGATLFIRDRIGVRLTQQGETLLRYCITRSQLEQELTSDIGKNQSRLTGTLRIAGYSSIMRSLILPTCQEVLKDNPEIKIDLATKELFELFELLKNASADFIVLDKKLEKEGITAIDLGSEVNVRIRKKGTDFNGVYLDHDEKDETTLRYLKLKSGAKLRRHFLGDIYGIIDGVQQGLGDAVVPIHLIRKLKNIDIIDEQRSLKNPIYLHFYEQPVQTRLHRIFIEKIKLVCGELV